MIKKRLHLKGLRKGGRRLRYKKERKKRQKKLDDGKNRKREWGNRMEQKTTQSGGRSGGKRGGREKQKVCVVVRSGRFHQERYDGNGMGLAMMGKKREGRRSSVLRSIIT